MRAGIQITRGIWISIPFTVMGFMMGGWILAIIFLFFCLFLWPVFVVDFLKEDNGKTFIKICGIGYLLVGLYGIIFEPMKRATSVSPGYEYTGWYFVSILSLIVSVAYLVVGFDILEKKNKRKVVPKSDFITPIKKKTRMTPKEFEQFVADYYQHQCYQTEITPYSGDYGVDVIAQKGEERIAIQAKMYGNSSRKVNRETIMQLYGAMTYRQCSKAVIATNGTCMVDAIEVANKLGVEILYFDSALDIVETSNDVQQVDKECALSNTDNPTVPFDEMWERYVMPLSGKTIVNGDLKNKIVSVDWGGLKRESSNKKVSRISIEEFKLAYDLLVSNGSVERTLINQHAKRCSSAIVLVLSQVPFIGVQDKPKIMLYLK